MSMSSVRPLTIDDLYEITLVSDPAVSPDEQRIAWVETRMHKHDDSYKAEIWIAGIDGGNARQLTSGSHRDTQPIWSPDGARLVFISNRPAAKSTATPDDQNSAGSAATQLWTIAADGGEAVQLTNHPNGASSPAWAPDSRRIVFVADDDLDDEAPNEAAVTMGMHADEVVVNDLRYRADGRGLIKRFAHIWAIDIATRQSVQLTDGDVQDNSPAWSPDGRSIAFLGDRSANRRTGSAQAAMVVPANGGDVRPVGPDDAVFNSLEWSPNGKRIALLGHEDAETGRTRNIAVWTVNSDDSKLRNHTEKVDVTFADVGMSDMATGSGGDICWIDADTLLVQGSDRGATRLFKVPLKSAKPVPITDKRERVLQADMRPKGTTIAFVAGSTDMPFELRTSTARGKRVKTIRNPNAGLVETVHLASPKEIDVTAPDGKKIQTWVLPPYGLDPKSDAKYPLVVQIHGGPHAMYGYALFHEMQVMASRGYGVVFCNPRGSSGYGEEFTGVTRGTWGESDMPDVIAAVEAATELPWVDSDRLGITGGSYGGYLTNWIIGHDTRFKAAVTQRCVSNFHSFVGTSDIGYDFGVYEFDGTPWSDAEKLLKHSPISYVENIETPLLILHAEHDLRCPIEQAEQMFTALRYLGKEVAFVRMPDESHDLSRSGTPSRRVARLQHLIGWFDNHL
ncbi:MAG: S9 family peptidase [Chloroflexota bacterium]|nr:S9 family peptidase [Chloroflexota bacterium]